MASGIGDTFFKETKYSRENVSAMRSATTERPPLYKEYPDKTRLALPKASAETLSLDQAFRNRKSIRRYAPTPLTLGQLSYLLWATAGVQRTMGDFNFRPAPSAGALYPIETYVVVNNVEGLPKGLYHFAVRPHALEELKSGDFTRDVVRATMGQRMHADAAVVFIWTAIFQRSKFRYHDRAYRYIYLDAGHIAQNLALAAVGLGLGSCQVGAYFDDEINGLLGVDGTEESVIYMSVVGVPG
ncbi:MAG: SagB/ThcOx family dehydrogenase [Dehalococcoidia bacterium]|nr:SagB/ThcOx family dehydrogenase [Dehalococcoidia bacterium]